MVMLGDGHVGNMISIDVGKLGGVQVVAFTCPCGEVQRAPIDKPGTLRGSVLRITDHVRNCAESRDSEPILSENYTRTIDQP